MTCANSHSPACARELGGGDQSSHRARRPLTNMFAFCAALAATACSDSTQQLKANPIPQTVLDSCVGARDITGDHPVGTYHMALVMDTLTRDGAVAHWESTEGESGIIRLEKADPLTKSTSSLSLEVAVVPTVRNAAQCNNRLVIVTWSVSDGQVIDGYSTNN